jgi:hypothetical protein
MGVFQQSERWGINMLFAVHYTTRPTAATKADTAALMTEFGKRGEVPGSIAHYVYPGGGGVVIAEQDDPSVLYESIIAYSEWLDFDVQVALTIDDAVPKIMNYLGA